MRELVKDDGVSAKADQHILETSMGGCFLKGYGQCRGKISGEHYISRTVLEAISPNGTTQIGGLPWQEPQTVQSIGVSSLVSNMLCERHNSDLSPLDSEAGKFFRTLDAADKRRHELPSNTQIDGQQIERWFLKVLCGLAAGPGINGRVVPIEWRAVLAGASWPEGWGLYASCLGGHQVLATEFFIETKVNPETRAVLAATFRVAGVSFNLLLGRPDNPAAWGIPRPRGLIFREGQEEVCVEFVWPFATNQAVIYTKVGSSINPPPQWQRWQS